MNPIIQFFFVLIGGDEAPIAYIIGIALSVTGGILITNTENLLLLILGIFLLFIGVVILILKIRKDIKEVRGSKK